MGKANIQATERTIGKVFSEDYVFFHFDHAGAYRK